VGRGEVGDGIGVRCDGGVGLSLGVARGFAVGVTLGVDLGVFFAVGVAVGVGDAVGVREVVPPGVGGGGGVPLESIIR
jgi:hypothetical protein